MGSQVRSAAFVFWQRQNAQMKQIEDSWAQGTKRMWRSFRRLTENRPALLPPMAQQRGPEAAGAGRSSRAPAPALAPRCVKMGTHYRGRSVWNLEAAHCILFLSGTLATLPRAYCPAPRQEVAPYQLVGLAPPSQTHGSVECRGRGQAQIRGAFGDGRALCCAGRRGSPALGSATASVVTSEGLLCRRGPLDACGPACELAKRGRCGAASTPAVGLFGVSA